MNMKTWHVLVIASLLVLCMVFILPAQINNGGGGSGSGTVSANNGSAGAVANYAAAVGSTTVGPDQTLIDNGTAWVGTEPFRLGDGSAAAPSYAFSGAVGTGFSRSGANVVLSIGGAAQIALTSSSGVSLNSGDWFAWSSTSDPTASNDTTLARLAAHVVGVGVNGDTSGTLKTAAYMSVGTKFTSNAGCTEGTLVGGATAGKFTVGQSTACTIIITMGNSATSPNGWTCTAYDQTAVPAVAIRQTASTATTCSLLMTVATSDVITFSAIGY